jgi:hypothetical protein
VEKCEKLWPRNGRAVQRNAVPGEVYSISEAGAAMEMRACSACAGDYEDPDRTVWTPDDQQEEERNGAPGAAAEEFPAEER